MFESISLLSDIQVCNEIGVELLGGAVLCHQQFFEKVADKRVQKLICSMKLVISTKDIDIKLSYYCAILRV
jgi:hypothetical protein